MKGDVRCPFGSVGVGKGEGGAGPDVPEGDPVEGVSRGPDGGEAVDQDAPEGGDGDVACGAG